MKKIFSLLALPMLFAGNSNRKPVDPYIGSIGWKNWKLPRRENGQIINLSNHPCKSRQSKRNK